MDFELSIYLILEGLCLTAHYVYKFMTPFPRTIV